MFFNKVNKDFNPGTILTRNFPNNKLLKKFENFMCNFFYD